MRLNYINENDVYEDPTASSQYVDSLKEYCLKVLNFSEELTNLLLENSKMSNWPEKFKTKELLKENKSEFFKLSK